MILERNLPRNYGKWEDRQTAGIRSDKEPKECKDQKEFKQS